MMVHPKRPLLATRAVVGLLAGLLLTAQATAQSLSDPNLSVTTVVADLLTQPTAMAFVAPGDFLVLEKSGTVRRVLNGVLQPTPARTVFVNDSSEHGLLGIAVNTEVPRKVFLFYTESLTQGGSSIGNRVYRYTWNSTTGLLESPQMILDLPVSLGPNHNGGTLLLGPAGQASGVGDGALLYVVIGDLNNNGQLENFATGPAPDDTSVILRVRQDGTAAPGNPFTPYCRGVTSQSCSNDGACGGNGPCELKVAKYFAYGVRNCFGMTLDPVNGRLWDTENGDNNFDEVNRVAPGFNSGWERIMGPVALDAQGTSDLFNIPGGGSAYSDPEFSWSLTIAPTGIVLPAGSSLGADYDGKVIVGDFSYAQLYAIPLDASRNGFNLAAFPDLGDLVADNNAERDQLRIGSGFGANFNGVTDLKIGPDGALYVVAISGSVYRITGSGAGPSQTTRPPQPDLRDLGRRLGEAASGALGTPP